MNTCIVNDIVIVWILTGPSYQVQVTDGASAGHRDMTLKDWMTYSGADSRDGFLMMSIEFSRTKLEKCIERPEIVCFVRSISLDVLSANTNEY